MYKTSVIITSHNYGDFLSWCISSVLHQKRKPLEIIVIDDNSTDSTESVARSYDGCIDYYKVCFNNAQSTRNFGLSKAKGEYLLFLDADDFLDNDCLEIMERELDGNPELKLVYGDRYNFGKPDLLKRLHIGPYWQTVDFSIERLRKDNFISLTSLMRRSLFGGFDENIRRLQDWDAWLSLLKKDSDAKHIAWPLFHARFHGENITVDKNYFIEKLKVLVKHGQISRIQQASADNKIRKRFLEMVLFFGHGLTMQNVETVADLISRNTSSIKTALISTSESPEISKELHAALLRTGVVCHLFVDRSMEQMFHMAFRETPYIRLQDGVLIAPCDDISQISDMIAWRKEDKPMMCSSVDCDLLMKIGSFEEGGVFSFNGEASARLFNKDTQKRKYTKPIKKIIVRLSNLFFNVFEICKRK